MCIKKSTAQLVLIHFFALSLTACNGITQETIVPSPFVATATLEPLITQTNIENVSTPTHSQPSTETPTSEPTKTDTPTASINEFSLPLPAAGTNIEQSCSSASYEEVRDVKALAGLIGTCDDQACIFVDTDEGMVMDLILPTSVSSFSNPIVSPGGTWIAYQEVEVVGDTVNTDYLWLVSTIDDQTFTIDWDENWARIDTWLNDEQLVIVPKDFLTARIVLDPFTQTRTEVSIEPLNLFPGNDVLSSFVSINADLSKLIYLHDFDENGTLGDGIWDVNNESALWEASAYDQVIAGLSNPTWSPVGDVLGVALGDANGTAEILFS